jgi:hypothetical protein
MQQPPNPNYPPSQPFYDPTGNPQQPQTYYPPQSGQPGMYPPQQPGTFPPPSPQPMYYPPQQQPGMYPPPPAPQKKRRGRTWLIVGIVIIVLLAACGGIANLVSNASKSANTGATTTSQTSTQSQSSSQTTTSSQPSSQTFKTGQTVAVGNTWQIDVLSAKTSTGSQYNKPQHAGNVFLVFTISMKNITSQEQNVSSLLQWSLQDSTGQKYDETIDIDAGSTLDGKVEAGMPLKGAIAYEVPGNVHTFSLSFQNDITSAGQTIWSITV